MLSSATLGLAGYGLYAAGSGLAGLLGASRLEVWADLLLIVLGVVLVVAAAFVRVQIPGGLPLALGALLGLQALALHNAAHLYGRIAPAPQIARGVLAAVLLALGYAGAGNASRR
jgi:hypothetical protein